MRLDCPKCGAKGDSRLTKTPKWRCSPARSNGGCGYEWDDPRYDNPTIDYRKSEIELRRAQWQLENAHRQRAAQEKQRLEQLGRENREREEARTDSQKFIDSIQSCGGFILVMVVIITLVCTFGEPEDGWRGGDDHYDYVPEEPPGRWWQDSYPGVMDN